MSLAPLLEGAGSDSSQAVEVVPYLEADEFAAGGAAATMAQDALATVTAALVRTYSSSVAPEVQHTALELLLAAWEVTLRC